MEKLSIYIATQLWILSTLGDTTQLLIAQFFRILIIGIVHTKDMYNDFKIRILH